MTEDKLIKEYNHICNKHKGKSLLQDLTDHELFIFIAAKTFSYGRTLDGAINNATYHMKNRSKAEKLFGTKINDHLF